MKAYELREKLKDMPEDSEIEIDLNGEGSTDIFEVSIVRTAENNAKFSVDLKRSEKEHDEKVALFERSLLIEVLRTFHRKTVKGAVSNYVNFYDDVKYNRETRLAKAFERAVGRHKDSGIDCHEAVRNVWGLVR